MSQTFPGPHNRLVRITASLFTLIILVSGPSAAVGQSQSGLDQIREGLALFKQGDFQQAIIIFRNIIFDSAYSAYKPDAYFWISRSYMAINQLDDAERNLEFFLAGYPEHPDYPEAYYQKGRLLFRQGELESGIQLLQSFINRYPDSPFLPNAYFWIGESLYLLGQLEEAAAVFNKMQMEYPKSFKVEAARYRLSLIEFKKREIELLKLLKWSHEESLKTVEEFQRREKSYEQAIAAYQRRLSYLKQGVDWEKDDELILDIEQLKSENAALKDQNEKLRLLPGRCPGTFLSLLPGCGGKYWLGSGLFSTHPAKWIGLKLQT